jgi:hypothetical protein
MLALLSGKAADFSVVIVEPRGGGPSYTKHVILRETQSVIRAVEEIQKARKDLRKAKENLANANSRLEQEWAKPRVNPKRQKSLKQEEETLRIALETLPAKDR